MGEKIPPGERGHRETVAWGIRNCKRVFADVEGVVTKRYSVTETKAEENKNRQSVSEGPSR